MNCEVRATRSFQRAAKFLHKKYPSLRGELAKLEDELLAIPTLGVQIQENIYKIRIAIKSKGKGKSGGARVVTYVEAFVDVLTSPDTGLTVVNLLTIYDKSDRDDIEDFEIKEILEEEGLI